MGTKWTFCQNVLPVYVGWVRSMVGTLEREKLGRKVKEGEGGKWAKNSWVVGLRISSAWKDRSIISHRLVNGISSIFWGEKFCYKITFLTNTLLPRVPFHRHLNLPPEIHFPRKIGKMTNHFRLWHKVLCVQFHSEFLHKIIFLVMHHSSITTTAF